MVIVRLIGGLGSQMSEYAYAKALESKGYDVKIDATTFESYTLRGYELDKYNIDLECSTKEENDRYRPNNIVIKILSRILNKIGINILSLKVVREKSFIFNQKLLEINNEAYVIGDFFSEKYFKDIRSTLLKQFSIKGRPSSYMKDMEVKISEAANSCFIHVRRGDYFHNKRVNKVHGVCGVDYYQNAAKYVQSQVGSLQYFIFSNDIEWCKENLKIDNATYMENQERASPHEDIYLMSLCKHNIIDHSSFCWWGAWLNQNENKIVVAPKKWFSNEKLQKQSRDIYCESWVKK